jgi:alcohol oxidase
MATYRGEFEPDHPRFPEGSQAGTRISTGPVDVSSPDIIYSAEDNEAIDIFNRERGQSIPSTYFYYVHRVSVGTTWHSVR